MSNLSASNIGRARHCLWWTREDVSFTRPPAFKVATDGTETHDALAAWINRQPPPDIGPDAKRMAATAIEWWMEKKRGVVSARSEVSYAYDLASGSARELGVSLDRDYSACSPTEVPGTLDYEFIAVEDKLLVIGDWKTGSSEDVEPADRNAQLLFLALAASRAKSWFGMVRVELAYIRADRVWVEAAILTARQLDEFAEELTKIWLSRDGAEAARGEHCRYCDAFGQCPATKDQLASVVPAGSSLERPVVWSTEFLSVENDVAMLEMLPALERAIDAVKTALKERAKASGGIQMGSGKVYKEITYQKDVFDPQAAEALIGPERLAQCRKKITVTQFKKVKA